MSRPPPAGLSGGCSTRETQHKIGLGGSSDLEASSTAGSPSLPRSGPAGVGDTSRAASNSAHITTLGYHRQGLSSGGQRHEGRAQFSAAHNTDQGKTGPREARTWLEQRSASMKGTISGFPSRGGRLFCTCHCITIVDIRLRMEIIHGAQRGGQVSEGCCLLLGVTG